MKKELYKNNTSKTMVNKSKMKNKKFWDEILNCEKLMSDEEAQEFHKITKEFRKEKGFRE